MAVRENSRRRRDGECFCIDVLVVSWIVLCHCVAWTDSSRVGYFPSRVKRDVTDVPTDAELKPVPTLVTMAIPTTNYTSLPDNQTSSSTSQPSSLSSPISHNTTDKVSTMSSSRAMSLSDSSTTPTTLLPTSGTLPNMDNTTQLVDNETLTQNPSQFQTSTFATSTTKPQGVSSFVAISTRTTTTACEECAGAEGSESTSIGFIILYALCGVITMLVIILLLLFKRHKGALMGKRSGAGKRFETLSATHTRLSTGLRHGQVAVGKDNPVYVDENDDRSEKTTDEIQPASGTDSETSTTSHSTEFTTLPRAMSEQGTPIPNRFLPNLDDANFPVARRFMWRRSNTVSSVPNSALQRQTWKQTSSPSKGAQPLPPPLPGGKSPPPLPGEKTLRRQTVSNASFHHVVAAALPKGAPPAPPPIPRGGFPPAVEAEDMDSKSSSSLDTVASTTRADVPLRITSASPVAFESKPLAVQQTSPEAEEILAQVLAALKPEATSTPTGVYATVQARLVAVDDTYLAPTDNVAIHYDRIPTSSPTSQVTGYATIGQRAQQTTSTPGNETPLSDSQSNTLRRQSLHRSSRRSRKTPSAIKSTGPPSLTRIPPRSLHLTAHMPQSLSSPQEEPEDPYAVPHPNRSQAARAELEMVPSSSLTNFPDTHTVGSSGVFLADSEITSSTELINQASQPVAHDDGKFESLSLDEGMVSYLNSRETVSTASTLSRSSRRTTLRGERQSLAPCCAPTAANSVTADRPTLTNIDNCYWVMHQNAVLNNGDSLDRYAAMAERHTSDLSFYRSVETLQFVSAHVGTPSYF